MAVPSSTLLGSLLQPAEESVVVAVMAVFFSTTKPKKWHGSAFRA